MGTRAGHVRGVTESACDLLGIPGVGNGVVPWKLMDWREVVDIFNNFINTYMVLFLLSGRFKTSNQSKSSLFIYLLNFKICPNFRTSIFIHFELTHWLRPHINASLQSFLFI